MNVVYRGLPNPISIFLPEGTSYTVSAPGLSKDEKGKYFLNPGTGTEVFVTVVYKKSDGKSLSERHKFKILNLPPFDFVFKDMSYSICKNCIFEFSKSDFQNTIISIKANRALPFEFNFGVSYLWFIFSEEKSIRIEGNAISNDVVFEIERLKKGSVFTIKIALDTQADIFLPPVKIMVVD